MLTSLNFADTIRSSTTGLAVILLFLAVACSNSETTSLVPLAPSSQPETAVPHTSTTPAPEESPDGLIILQGSHEHMLTASSFQTTVSTEYRSIGQAMKVSTSVSRNLEGMLRLATTMQGPEGSEQRTELILDQAYVYVRLPSGQWRRTTTEAMANSTGLDLKRYEINFFGDLIPSKDPPWNLYKIKYLGREETAGVDTHHLGVTVNLQNLMTRMGPVEVEQLLASAGLTGAPSDVLDEARIAGVEIWVDDEGVPSKLKAEFLGGGKFTSLQIETSDVGKNVAIALPVQYEEGMPEPEAPTLSAMPDHRFDLGSMLLTPTETTPVFLNMELNATGRQPIDAAAADTINPADTAEDLETWGRLDGHVCFFIDAAVLNRQVTGRPATLQCSVQLYETDELASAAVQREISDYLRLAGQSIGGSVTLISFEEASIPNVGTGAVAARAVVSNNSGDMIYIDLVMWVRGQVTATVTLVSFDDADRKDPLDQLAVAMDGRVVRALEP